MRDRLSNMIQNAVNGCAKYWADVIADHLLANGVIVPFAECGAEIYGAFEWCPEEVFDGCLSSYSHQIDGVWFHCYYSNGLNMWHKIEDFGKTVFLTREEAEEALKGSNDGKAE